jgi:hypothetical protein
MVTKLLWEYEDELEIDITESMFKISKVDGVRLYPYVIIENEKCYLEK